MSISKTKKGRVRIIKAHVHIVIFMDFGFLMVLTIVHKSRYVLRGGGHGEASLHENQRNKLMQHHQLSCHFFWHNYIELMFALPEIHAFHISWHGHCMSLQNISKIAATFLTTGAMFQALRRSWTWMSRSESPDRRRTPIFGRQRWQNPWKILYQ